MRQFRYLSLFILFLGACSSYEKVLKSDDVNYKLTKANEYYNKKQYSKANEVYDKLMPVMRGTKNFEPLYFRFAYTNYYLKNYEAASYHFKNFVDQFPGSTDAEEAEYMHALSLFKLSPKTSLEQTYTIKAIEAMQDYINGHPNSKRVAEANKMIDDMRAKLEEKEASAAKLYYNIGQYKAATIAYKSVMENYPESVNNDLYQYMIVRANYNFAKASVEAKQEERFANAISAYNEFKESYPNSKYIQEALKYYQQSNEKLNEIRHGN